MARLSYWCPNGCGKCVRCYNTSIPEYICERCNSEFTKEQLKAGFNTSNTELKKERENGN